MANSNREPVSVGDWMITLLLASIPLVGLILMLVWAFSDGTAASKSNWAKATLLWAVMLLVIYLLILVLFGGAILALGSRY